MREIARELTDTEAAYNVDPAAGSQDEVIVAYPSLEALAGPRLAHELQFRQRSAIPRIMTEWVHPRTGTDLHPGGPEVVAFSSPANRAHGRARETWGSRSPAFGTALGRLRNLLESSRRKESPFNGFP
jgi:hypothetical protein